MDSPVQIPFKSFIQLKPEEPTALYLQIVFEFIKAIQMGLLPEGTKLPGTRILAQILHVNRNTLIKAFDDLELQGWIAILPNKGTFVLSENKDKKQKIDLKNSSKDTTGFTFERSTLLENPNENSNLTLQFNDGLPDLRLMQTDVLARLYLSKLKNLKTNANWKQIQTDSHSNFKKQFSNFLNLTRSLGIDTSNLLTTSSHEISLYLVCKILIKPNDAVIIAAPGYYNSTMTIANCGAKIHSIHADQEGISTQHIKQLCESQKIRMVYITSNYHYPTQTPLSVKRRMELLELADYHDFIILEDDYYFDFHYDNNPALPLASLHSNQKVVYISSVGKSLPIGFGFGFVTAPADFILELEKHQNLVEPAIDILKEKVISEWIKEGEAHRLAKKIKKTYKERRDYFDSLLQHYLKNHIRYEIPQRGLAFWVEWLDPFNLVHFQKICEQKGLFLPKTILYQTKEITATRLGFGHLNEEEMENSVRILKDALLALLRT